MISNIYYHGSRGSEIPAKSQLLHFDKLESRLKNIEKKTDHLTSNLSEKDKKIEELESQLNAVLNSRSWKMTAPLRAMMMFFYKIKNFIKNSFRFIKLKLVKPIVVLFIKFIFKIKSTRRVGKKILRIVPNKPRFYLRRFIHANVYQSKESKESDESKQKNIIEDENFDPVISELTASAESVWNELHYILKRNKCEF